MLEDLNIFFQGSEFAVEGLINDTVVMGILDREFLAIGVGAEGRSLVFCCKSSDVLNVHHGDQLTIQNVAYTIVGIEPQGDGAITDLVLKV